MLADPEHFKGISFVRISSLPAEQKSKIRENFDRELIVKILRDNSLINDCIVYTDYLNWYRAHRHQPLQIQAGKPMPVMEWVTSKG
jgi:hypothetical protein